VRKRIVPRFAGALTRPGASGAPIAAVRSRQVQAGGTVQFARACAGKMACGAIALLAACSDDSQPSDREHPIVTAPRIVARAGRSLVHLDEAALQRAGIRSEPVRRLAQPETLLAFATVVDLQPLIQLSASLQGAQAQLKTAQARLAASRAEYERERQLFDDQQTVSAARLQSSQAVFLADQAAQAAAQAQVEADRAAARLGWGPALAEGLGGEDPQRGALADDLLARRQLLLQVALNTDFTDDRPPTHGRVLLEGRDGPAIQLLSAAAHADPRLAGRSYLYRSPPDPALQPGASVRVGLATGRSVEGARIPASALVWWQGRAWVFIRSGTGDFERREIPVDRIDHASTLQANLDAGTEVVVQGAQVLLSEELRAQSSSTDVGGR
jgi:hypothetical protein